jgi:SAM-dependent methyltransferase
MPGSFLGVPTGQHESLDRMAEAGNYNGWLLERARPFVGTRVLDFGAGLGTFSAALATAADVVALEPDPKLVSQLESRFADEERVTVASGDAGWLERDDSREAFDTILCFNVLEHIREDEAVLRSFRKCLVPGGHLLLLVPAHGILFGEIDRSVGHERRYSRASLYALFGHVGLSGVDVRYVNPLGAIGWFVSSRLLRRPQVPLGPLRVYDRLVPSLQRLDGLRLPFGLSVWAVARRDA